MTDINAARQARDQLIPTPAREMVFVVPGLPHGKERPRLGARGNVYTPARTTGYEAKVKVLAQIASGRQRWLRTAGARLEVTLSVRFPDARRRDLDNVAKAILDGLNGVAYEDDSQVDALHVYRLDTSKKDPRVEVRVKVYEGTHG